MNAQKCTRPPGRNALCTVRREIKNAVPSVVVYTPQCQVHGWWNYLSSVLVRVVHQIRDDVVRQAIVQLEHCAVAVAFNFVGTYCRIRIGVFDSLPLSLSFSLSLSLPPSHSSSHNFASPPPFVVRSFQLDF